MARVAPRGNVPVQGHHNKNTTGWSRYERLQPIQRFRMHLLCLYNGGIWAVLTILLFAQVFGIIWSSVQVETLMEYGQSPMDGPYEIPGFNDEPYSDRAVVCVKRGRTIRPMQLSQLLLQEQQQQPQGFPSPVTNGIDGYRVVSRDSFTMDASSFAFYVRQCNAIALTLDNIFSACAILGYNTTQDVLRIVHGIHTSTVTVLPNTLPVLILPYWDHGALSRYAVPGHDGSACMFRANGVFESDTADVAGVAVLNGIPRQLREATTAQWLGLAGGVWKNGWYEDPIVKMRWYSDLISSIPGGRLGIGQMQFDLFQEDVTKEKDCSHQPPLGCGGGVSSWTWGSELRVDQDLQWMESVAVSNGSRYGLFLFAGFRQSTITSQYSLSKLISNASFAVLLAKWMAAMVALYPNDTIGIGALANCRAFYLLPLFLLPRLKDSLTCFWTAGLMLEGDQRALSDSWFEVYPAIGEVVLIYFSALNSLSKLLRMRMSDGLFGPTLLLFGWWHFFRYELAASGWFHNEFDKRVSSAVTSNDLAQASVWDFFTSDLAWRTNGRVALFFAVKIAVLAMNLVPLCVSMLRAVYARRATKEEAAADGDGGCSAIEDALSIEFRTNCGLGATTSPYIITTNTSKNSSVRCVRPYEVVRVGYVVVGRRGQAVLTSIDHWMWLFGSTPLRYMDAVLAVRVVVYEVDPPVVPTTEGKVHGVHGDVWSVHKCPRILVATDKALLHVKAWQISARAFR